MLFRKNKKIDPKKASQYETKGDQYTKSKKFKKALKTYQYALECNPENTVLYEKLIETKRQIEGEWTEEDFSETLSWTLRKQEIENPAIKNVYETLTPEYTQVKQLIAQMLVAPPENKESYITKIMSFEKKAVLPLLDTLLALDTLAREVSEKPDAASVTVAPLLPSEKDKPGETS